MPYFLGWSWICNLPHLTAKVARITVCAAANTQQGREFYQVDHVNQILLNWNRPPDNSNSIRSECGLSIVGFCKLPKMIFKNGQIDYKMYIGEKTRDLEILKTILGKVQENGH